jgi:hypothetical protein
LFIVNKIEGVVNDMKKVEKEIKFNVWGIKCKKDDKM